jgi:hypothetical protein
MAWKDLMRGLMASGELLLPAQELRSRMGDQNYRRFLNGVFRNAKVTPSSAHAMLSKMDFVYWLPTMRFSLRRPSRAGPRCTHNSTTLISQAS